MPNLDALGDEIWTSEQMEFRRGFGLWVDAVMGWNFENVGMRWMCFAYWTDMNLWGAEGGYGTPKDFDVLIP